MLQAGIVSAAVPVAKLEEIAAGDRRHMVRRRKRDAPDDVRLGVGYVEPVVCDCEPRRLCKGALFSTAIDPRFTS